MRRRCGGSGASESPNEGRLSILAMSFDRSFEKLKPISGESHALEEASRRRNLRRPRPGGFDRGEEKKSDGDGAPIAESAGGAVIAVRSCGVAILAGMILYGAIWAGHGFSGPARWCAIGGHIATVAVILAGAVWPAALKLGTLARALAEARRRPSRTPNATAC